MNVFGNAGNLTECDDHNEINDILCNWFSTLLTGGFQYHTRTETRCFYMGTKRPLDCKATDLFHILYQHPKS